MPEESTASNSVPGERALAAMKEVNENVFKMPLVPAIKGASKTRKSVSQVVMEEETYIEEMGSIIQRDFFPDLERLKAQNEYLDAVEKNDILKLRELHAKYSSGIRPPTERYASPATFETPVDLRSRGSETPGLETPRSERLQRFQVKETDNTRKQSLDQYLSGHTSEDNQSFQEIMKEAEEKHRHKYSWLYEAEDRHRKEREKQLALPSIEAQAQIEDKPLNVDNWEYKNKNYIMYVPDGVALTQEERVEMAKVRQEVVHTNTRMVRCPFDERQSKAQIQEMAHNQARTQDGRIGVDGLIQTSDIGPHIKGFGFVKTPSPAPGVNETPLMTWGEIEGTPFRLDGSDTPVRPSTGPSFRMAQPPKREKLALALAEKAGQRHRDRKQKAIEAARKQLATPTPSRTISLASMSPAAQRLASTQLRRRVGPDSALRASYSPSPARSSIGGSTPLRSLTPLVRTPSRTPGKTPSRTSDSQTITDDLLNLPKRPRAADFFG